jgi:Fic family protein
MYKISVAEYRQGEEPMQIVSGAMGHEKVHYEAPSSSDIPHEMDLFLEWINKPCDIDPVIKAAIAHLWFVAIHPFDDGNGRLTRTITDMMLSRSDGQRLRFYSMSAEIMRKRNSYYEILQKTTTGDLCITDWLLWFFETMESAIIRSYDTLLKIRQKAIFWQNNSEVTFNERQVKILNRLLDGFEGKLTTSKYAKICHTSQATALRDIQDLLERDILVKTESGGRSSGYEIK